MTAVGRNSVRGVDDIEVFPVNFLVDGGTVVLRTAPGTALAMIADGVSGTFEADEDRQLEADPKLDRAVDSVRLATTSLTASANRLSSSSLRR
jgi:hypothetical protein